MNDRSIESGHTEPARQLFEQWELYDAIITHDYMRHQELAAAIRNLQVSQEPRVLDLGCGDSWLAWHALQSRSPVSYLGVDLSESALDRARSRLASWPARCTLRQGELSYILTEMPNAGFDLVIASYSLHHLAEPDRQQIFLQIGRVLAANGIFICADVIRGETESHDDALDRLERHVRGQWTALTVEQCDRVVDHVRTSDYPASQSWMTHAAGRAGLMLTRMLLDDPCFAGFAFMHRDVGE